MIYRNTSISKNMAKSNLAKAKEISQATKEKVLERQGYRSISGVALNTADFHHVIYRSNSGIGYEWNIVAITPDEHRWLHDKQPIKVNGRNRYSWIEFEILMKNHLKLKYNGWTEEKCKFHKYWNEEDYGVTRRKGKL